MALAPSIIIAVDLFQGLRLGIFLRHNGAGNKNVIILSQEGISS